MGRARRSSLLQRQPTSLAWRSPHTSPIGKPAKTNMQLLRPETGGSDFGKVLQFEEYFAVCTFSISVNDGFSFLIVFCQGPWSDGLNIAGAKSWTAIGVKHVTTSRFVQYGPDFQPFSKFPTTTVQDGATAIKLSWFALIACPLGEIVKRLLAGNLQPNCFKSRIHQFDVVGKQSDVRRHTSLIHTRKLSLAFNHIIARRAFAVYVYPAYHA